MEKDIHPRTLKHWRERASRAVHHALGEVDYYANTEAGHAEIEKTVAAARHMAAEAGEVARTAVRGLAQGLARKIGDCCHAGAQAAAGDYRGAGLTLARMEARRVQNLGRAAGNVAGAAFDGAMLACYDEAQAARAARRARLGRRVKTCAVFGTALFLGAELMEAGDDEAGTADAHALDADESPPPVGTYWHAGGVLGDGDLLPDVMPDDLPGVENGILVDNSPENVALLADQGEIVGAEHHIEVERSAEARAAFLAAHDLAAVPEGYELHHIIPLSEGGADDPRNMILLREDTHDAITSAHRAFYGWPGPETWED